MSSNVPSPALNSRFIQAAGQKLHYLEAGAGEPVLLLHGWPTSSHLWRDVMPAIARTHRAIALDLPGFGASDKPLDLGYSFEDYERILGAFLDALGIERLSLVVHDLGGPVGLFWAVRNPERVQRLALCNTLVYPELSWMARLFLLGVRVPVARRILASPRGIAMSMRMGVVQKDRMGRARIEPYQAPFPDTASRTALLKTAAGLDPAGMTEIAEKLPRFTVPVRLIYGTEDRILPDVAETMARVARDLPQAEVTALPGCGHFLQEDEPEQVGELLADFFNDT